MEDASLELIEPPAEARLAAWLAEFYGKPVTISQRELLRHRDLSFVERLTVADGLPQSLIYKVVLPPWDIEQDLHERILVPSVSNSAQLYLAAHCGSKTVLFLEDMGSRTLKQCATAEDAARLGRELAKTHRAYCYRTDELNQLGVLRTLFPIDYAEFAASLTDDLRAWAIVPAGQCRDIVRLASLLAPQLAGEPISLVHGDLYAENVIARDDRLFVIDWSWFTHIGVPLMDLATLTMPHAKNGPLSAFAAEVIDTYCFESGRDASDVSERLPFAEALSRLLFLDWLVVRRRRGIMGTTVGPVDGVIASVAAELGQRLAALST